MPYISEKLTFTNLLHSTPGRERVLLQGSACPLTSLHQSGAVDKRDTRLRSLRSVRVDASSSPDHRRGL